MSAWPWKSRVRLGLGVLTTTVVALTACRAVIGYKSIAYDGAEGGVPLTDGGCPTTAPEVLFTTDVQLGNLVLGGDAVYAEIYNQDNIVTDAGGVPGLYLGFVRCAMSGCGGSPETLVSYDNIVDGVVWGGGTADDAGVAYALPTAAYNGAYSDAMDGVIESANPDGGGATVIASHLHYPYLVTVDGQNVYWTDDPFSLTFTDADVPLEWSVRTTHIGASLDASSVFLKGYTSATLSLFHDSKNVYLVAADSTLAPALFACPLVGPSGSGGGCGQNGQELVRGLPFPSGDLGDPFRGFDTFGADGVSLYQADLPNSEITRYDLATEQATAIAQGQDTPSNLAVGANDVFWSSGGVIYHASKSAPGVGTAAPLICGLSTVFGIAVTAERVYFLTQDPKNGSRYEVASVPLP